MHFVSFPRWIYFKSGQSRIVQDAEELATVAEEWFSTPDEAADAGEHAAPATEQSRDEEAEEVTADDTSEPVKRPRGRPRKVV